MTIEVRRATLDDLETLVPLFDAYRRFYGKPADPEAARAFLSERLGRGESVVFIVWDGSTAVGFTQLYPIFSSTRVSRMWLLNDLFVHDAARGQGAGAALLRRAREHAVETGACELILETAVDNPARRLYEREGWQHITEYVFYRQPL